MNRYTVHVPQHAPRMKLGAYVRHAFSLLPESAISQAFSRRDVKMDGIRCGREEYIKPGSEVAIFTTCGMEIPVVFENEHLLALDKPSGISCDADAYGSMTVLDWAKMYAEDRYTPRMCHRLDNQTSGLIVLAKDEATENALNMMFRQHWGGKEYRCVVRGTPTPSSKNCVAWLVKDPKLSRVRVYDHEVPGAKRIETEYAVLRAGKAATLRVLLHTGRTHQIRAHMAFLGHPVLGDDLYGDRRFNRECGSGRLMLRSVALRMDTQGAMAEIDGIQLKVPGFTD